MGIVLNDDRRPRIAADGIVASVPVSDEHGQRSFDYWALRSDGTFYTLRSYFEDERHEPGTVLYFNTRIVNITEAFLYARNLYRLLGAADDQVLWSWVRHDGLAGRALSSAGGSRHIPGRRVSSESAVESELRVRLADIDVSLVQSVRTLTAPVFVLFDFTEFVVGVYEDIVKSFVGGRPT